MPRQVHVPSRPLAMEHPTGLLLLSSQEAWLLGEHPSGAPEFEG